MRIRSAAENEWVVKMSVYQRLKDVRQDADKSQEEIAKIIGTSQSYYAQYENGKRAIPFERMVDLAKYYNVSLDYLAGLIDKPRKLKRNILTK
jgi:transcriptional regulator with XRE-family HTH domain